jgi:hypothetical protein
MIHAIVQSEKTIWLRADAAPGEAPFNHTNSFGRYSGASLNGSTFPSARSYTRS